MATGTTRLADLVQEQNWYDYLYLKTNKTSALTLSGIFDQTPEYDNMALMPSSGINMRVVQPLRERARGFKADGTNVTTSEKFVTAQMYVPFLKRYHKLGWNQLAAHIAGLSDFVSMGRASWGQNVKIQPGDTSAALALMMRDLWNEDLQQTLIALLNGVFASTTNVANFTTDNTTPGMASQSIDASITTGTITAANRISPATLGRSAALLSDRGGSLTTMIMHPQVYYGNLLPSNITPNFQTSGQDWQIPRYLDYNIILDDTLPLDLTNPAYPKYTTYLFGKGSICFGDGKLEPITGAEVIRDADQAEEYLFTRRFYMMQPKGISYAGATPVSGEGPSDADFSVGTAWKRSDFVKNINITRLITNG
jgi:hypothetical protein